MNAIITGILFTCIASLNGQEIARNSVPVTQETTENLLGTYKDVELAGTAIFGQVSALMFFDGVMFGAIGMNEASYTMYMLGEGELDLHCSLD